MRNQANIDDEFVTQIQNEMKRIRQDPIRRHGFMKYELDLMDARREGLHEGIEKTIKILRHLGLSDKQIISELVRTYDLNNEEAQKLIETISK